MKVIKALLIALGVVLVFMLGFLIGKQLNDKAMMNYLGAYHNTMIGAISEFSSKCSPDNPEVFTGVGLDGSSWGIVFRCGEGEDTFDYPLRYTKDRRFLRWQE